MHFAKEEVGGLIRTLGFSPIDLGALPNVREIEDFPVQRFLLWKMPLIISTVLLCCTFPTLFSKWITLFVVYLVWCFIESWTTFPIRIPSYIYGNHLLFATRKDSVCMIWCTVKHKYVHMSYKHMIKQIIIRQNVIWISQTMPKKSRWQWNY